MGLRCRAGGSTPGLSGGFPLHGAEARLGVAVASEPADCVFCTCMGKRRVAAAFACGGFSASSRQANTHVTEQPPRRHRRSARRAAHQVGCPCSVPLSAPSAASFTARADTPVAGAAARRHGGHLGHISPAERPAVPPEGAVVVAMTLHFISQSCSLLTMMLCGCCGVPRARHRPPLPLTLSAVSAAL